MKLKKWLYNHVTIFRKDANRILFNEESEDKVTLKIKEKFQKEKQFIKESEYNGSEMPIKMKKQLDIFIHVLLILSIIAMAIHFVFVGKVSGISMSPTFEDNQIVLTTAYTSLSYGDIVVYQDVNNDFKSSRVIKRVIALEGDTIYCEDGVVYVNGKAIEEDYIVGTTSDFDEVTIEDGEVFLMGDNRENSVDSRSVGTLKTAYITKKVVM
ncbi:signal peptidase I [Eubacterium oxidoreducens]|uniref:Signal peptidase I n=1 Tax=Eubacterium oxidoreducens TaxID=1732 RepID=A0A1G6C3V2_EUBOX|nr:signal peptidase I [Eubacterium oxidoreducens]SDB27549.1 signal peptidase I [Eubacterium oxidoreducens]